MTPYWFSCCCSAEGTIERHASTLQFSKVSKHLDTETQNKALEVKYLKNTDQIKSVALTLSTWQ